MSKKSLVLELSKTAVEHDDLAEFYEPDTDISDTEFEELRVEPQQHWAEMEKLVQQLQHEFKQVRLEEICLARECEKYKQIANKHERNELKLREKNKKLVLLLKEALESRNLVQSDVNSLRAQLSELRTELESARKGGDEMSEKNRLLISEIDELKINYKSATSSVQTLKEQLEQAKTEHAQNVTELEDEIDQLQSQVKSFKNRLEERQSELEINQRKIDVLNEQKTTYEVSIRQITSDLAKANGLLEERNRQLAELKAKHVTLENLLKEETKKLVELRAQTATQIRLLKDEKVVLQDEIDKKSHKINSLEADVADLSEEKAVLKKWNVIETMKQRKLINDIQNLEDAKEATEHSLQSANDQVAQLKRELNVKGEDLEHAKFKLAKAEKDSQAMFDELEEARKLKQKMEHTIKSQLEPKLEEHLKKASDQEARSEQARREMSELVAKLRKANKRVAKHKEASENREESEDNLKAELKRSRALLVKVKRENKELEDESHALKTRERRAKEENAELQLENERLHAEIIQLKIPQTKTTFSTVRYEVTGVTRTRTGSSSFSSSSDSD